MNQKEREQHIVFEKIKNKEITRSEAALQLGITERWVRKKYRRYMENGASGLTHRNRNRPSPKKWNEKEKSRAIALLEDKWKNFGPTFAAEKLKELEGITISKETLRKMMVTTGLWQAKKKKLKYRKRRERKDRLGQLSQFDGSPHDWFEGRGPRCVLLAFVDDATSQALWLEFAESESQISVITATRNYMVSKGRPTAVYVDFGSSFSVNNNNPERDKKTQWERIMEELSVTVHHAHSPQAKGRVERAYGTLQDRLIKEMRLAGISSIDGANNFLRTSSFIAEYNNKFAINPAKSGDVHRTMNNYNIQKVFSLQDERVLNNDHTISFNKRILQLSREQKTLVKPKDIITVKTYLDASIALFIRSTKLNFTEISKRHFRKKTDKNSIFPIPKKPSKNSQRWASGFYV